MLRFRDFRNKINEAEVAPDHSINAAIEELVDKWIDDLKHEILSGSTPPRGLWDRFRNTLANFWFGRNSEENPYKHRNLLGSMGEKVESVLENTCWSNESRFLRESFDIMEAEVAAPKDTTSQIKLIQIINKHGQILKDRLKQMLSGAYVPTVKKYQMPSLSAFPEKPKTTPTEKPQPKTVPEPDAVSSDAEPDTEVTPADTPKEELSFVKAPTENLDWHELSAEQKIAWNTYGGGAVPRSERHKGKFPLPWILRLGDPRKSLLSTDTLKSLIRDKRLEMEGDRIKSQEELEQRVQASQAIFRNRKRRNADTELRDEPLVPKSEKAPRTRGLPRPDISDAPQEDAETDVRNVDAGPDVSSTSDFRGEDEPKPERQQMATLNRLVADWPDEDQKKQLLKLARKMKKEDLTAKIKEFLQQTVDAEPDGDSKRHNQSMLDDQTEDVDSLNSTARLILGVFHPTEANRHYINKLRSLVRG